MSGGDAPEKKIKKILKKVLTMGSAYAIIRYTQEREEMKNGQKN